MADDLETWIELVGLHGATEFTKTREPSSEAMAVAREVMDDDKDNPGCATIALAFCLQYCSHDGDVENSLVGARTMLRRLCSAETTVLEEFLPGYVAGEHIPLGHSWAICRFALERASAFHGEAAQLDDLPDDLEEANLDTRIWNGRTEPSREILELAGAIIPDRMANYPWNGVAWEVLSICLQQRWQSRSVEQTLSDAGGQRWQSRSVEQTLSDAGGLLDRLCRASLCMKETSFIARKTRGELHAICEEARARLLAWRSSPARGNAAVRAAAAIA